MNILSLFDGMSCGRIALDRLGFQVNKYFASEIDKHAIKVSKDNWSDIIHIGDVTKVSYKDGVLNTEAGEYKIKIDLLIGGSPCQDFSTAKAFGQHGETPKGLDGTKSGLFYHYLRILNEIKQENPELKWLLENVKMKKESKEQLDKFLGVEGVYINSDLVSFQKRARCYWSNLKFSVPEDKGVSFQTFKSKSGDLSSYKLNRTPSRERMWNNGQGGNSSSSCANVTYSDKVYCLTTKQDRCPNSGLVEYEDFCRYLTRTELELAQTVDIGYTNCLSYNQACAVLGNGWTVDVICHILKNLKEEEMEEDKIQDTSKLQLASVKAFMEQLGYSYFNVDRAFYSPMYTNKARSWISFNTAVRLHNLGFIDWHGKLFREPFNDFPEEWITKAKQAKIVRIVKMQNSKKRGIVVQSNIVEFCQDIDYKLFIRE